MKFKIVLLTHTTNVIAQGHTLKRNVAVTVSDIEWIHQTRKSCKTTNPSRKTSDCIFSASIKESDAMAGLKD